MKNFSEVINNKKIAQDFLNSKNVEFYEMLDLPYFNISIINSENPIILKKNHQLVDDVDYCLNSMWEDVYNFTSTNIKPHIKDILEKVGPCIIGLFYCPNNQPHNIKYPNDLVGKFILGSIKNLESGKKISNQDLLFNIIGNDIIMRIPKMVYQFCKIDTIKNDLITDIQNMNHHFTSYSGLPLNEIEGVVVSANYTYYKIDINNSSESDINIENFTTYNSIITDFINVYDDKIKNFNKFNSYIDNVSYVFTKYIENSQYIKNDNIDSKSLVAPGNTSVLNYSKINNESVKTFCLISELYRNIYKILLNGLRKHKKYCTIGDIILLTQDEVERWNQIVDYIVGKF